MMTLRDEWLSIDTSDNIKVFLNGLSNILENTTSLLPVWEGDKTYFCIIWQYHGLFIVIDDKNNQLKLNICQSFVETDDKEKFILKDTDDINIFFIEKYNLISSLIPRDNEQTYVIIIIYFYLLIRLYKIELNTQPATIIEICCFRSLIRFRFVEKSNLLPYIEDIEKSINTTFFNYNIESYVPFTLYKIENHVTIGDMTWHTGLLPRPKIKIIDNKNSLFSINLILKSDVTKDLSSFEYLIQKYNH